MALNDKFTIQAIILDKKNLSYNIEQKKLKLIGIKKLQSIQVKHSKIFCY